MAKFVTDASGATWWPNLESMPVSFFLLAEEITQVKEAITWVRCASGNVFPSVQFETCCKNADYCKWIIYKHKGSDFKLCANLLDKNQRTPD